MVFVVGRKEESLLVGKGDGTAHGTDKLILMLDRFRGGYCVSVGILLGQGRRTEAPGVEDRVANEVRNRTVVLIATRLDGEV